MKINEKKNTKSTTVLIKIYTTLKINVLNKTKPYFCGNIFSHFQYLLETAEQLLFRREELRIGIL